MMTLFDVTDEFPVRTSAILSDDGMYRYSLNRWWNNEKPWHVWIMLNPSTADANKDDPTVRRCIAFSRRWGAGGIHVVNLYAYRATKPAAIWTAADNGVDIIGPDCDGWITAHAKVTSEHPGGRIIAAWGAHGRPERIWRVMQDLRGRDVHALGTTAGGMPRHPLYVKGDTELEPWTWPGAA